MVQKIILQRVPACFFCFISILFFFSNCSNTRYLQEAEFLLHKNTIKVESQGKFVKKFVSKSQMIEELSILYKQNPNKKVFKTFKIRLWVFNRANRKKENRWRWWWKNKAGEPASIYDSTLAAKTARTMENYLYNKGYLYPEVNFTARIVKKRAYVTYQVKPKDLYTIRNVYFPQNNDDLSNIIQQNQHSSLFKKGNHFDFDLLKLERERIASDFKNDGYFNFNKEFIYFELDTSEATKELDIYTKIHLPPGADVSRIYYINDVFIYTQYASDKNAEKQHLDTMKAGDYTFIGPPLRIKPEIILDDVFLKKGQRYSLKNYQLTLNRIADMGIFKFIDVLFKPSEKDTAAKNLLDCYIYLIPAKKQEITLEGEISTGSESYFGTAGKFTYRNKNMLNRADIFVWNLNAGIESQLFRNNEFVQNIDSLIRNVDLSTQFNFYLSEFLGPKWWSFSQQFNPKTRLSTGYNFLQRVDLYNLTSINFLFGYDWKEFTYKRHNLNPLNLSFVLVNKETELFRQKLQTNSLLKNSFIDQVIIGSSYTFLFNNQEVNKIKNFVYFRGNLDVAGLTTRTLSGLVNDFDFSSDSRYKIGGIDFAQYIRADIDLRHYNIFNKSNTFVTRLNAGIGTAYWNSSVLPYIKQYYAGGQYSIRAWRVRELGPGSYKDTSITLSTFPDQTGDMKLEMNAEYRFNIIGIFKGALFTDAGNIWTVRKGETRTGASFSTENFYKEIAIGSGFGLRFDFTFFILRVDLAFKLRDPSLPEKNRWIWHKADITWNQSRKDMTLNLAIGYPF